MNYNFKKTIFLISDVLLFLIIFLLVFYLFFENKFDNKIYPNIYFNNTNLGGLSPEDAKKIIEKEIENFDSKGLRILAEKDELIWRRDIFSFDPDLASQTVFFDIVKTSDEAFLLGRSGRALADFYFKFSSFFNKRQVKLSFLLDEEKIKNYLYDNFSDSISLSESADIKSNQMATSSIALMEEGFIDSKNENPSNAENIIFYVVPEVYGKQINYDIFFSDFKNNLSQLKNEDIKLYFLEGEPEIKAVEAGEKIDEAYDLLDLAPFDLIYFNGTTKESFSVDKNIFSTWFSLKKTNSFNEEKIEISLNPDYFFEFLKTTLSLKIEKEAIKPQFEFENDKVKFFSPGQNGLKINAEKTFSNLLNAFTLRDMSNVNIETDVFQTEDLSGTNDMGIKELIGSGHSNFAGSPTNRRHNIKTGAEKLNGLIIKPGEEFSLVTALGPTTKEAGYLPELVIKGNKTIPEYGGGLCQVATTMFRAALGTGLPITERRNHSYRVSYYEPAGTDATIYSPRPDLKFKNDTEHNILIQARFEGTNDMYFDFWGTSDGRVASTTYPVIYNIVRPGPTQIIETTDLKPGEKKCTEKAHSGAEAYFDYTVVYKSGSEEENKVETRFYSKYVPWREVCLVGVEAKPEEEKVEEIKEEAGNTSPLNSAE